VKLSYVHGVGTTPLIADTLGGALNRAAERWGDRDALVACHQQLRYSYRELRDEADRAARALIALGVQRGDRLRLMPELMATGTGPLQAQRVPALRRVIYLGTDAEPGGIPWAEFLDLGNRISAQELEARETELQFDDPINIQYTSGTTGSPKGATLSHHDILNNGYITGEVLRYTEHDRICAPVPFYHCFGCVLGNMAALTNGSAVVIPGESFDPDATLRAIEAERCTCRRSRSAMA